MKRFRSLAWTALQWTLIAACLGLIVFVSFQGCTDVEGLVEVKTDGR